MSSEESSDGSHISDDQVLRSDDSEQDNDQQNEVIESNDSDEESDHIENEEHSEEEEEEEDVEQPTKTNVSGPPSYNPPPPSYVPSSPKSKSPNPNSFFKVHKSYLPEEDDNDSLKLKKGDIIIFLSTVDKDWYKGQLGDEVGNFRADHVEQISDEDVKAFISQQAKKTIPTGPVKSKEELKDEMKLLKDEEEETQEKINKLEAEIEKLKEQASKSRKDLRMSLSQSMEVFPAALYHIDPIESFRSEIMKIIINLENLVQFESGESKETITVLSEQINVFISTLSIFQQDSKLKAIESILTQARMFLTGLINEMSSYDANNTISIIKELEMLHQILGDKKLVQESLEKEEEITEEKTKRKKKKSSKVKSPSSTEKKTKKKKKVKKTEKS